MGPPLVTRQVSNLLVVHFIGRLSLETKPRLKSWPTIDRLTSAYKAYIITVTCHIDSTHTKVTYTLLFIY